MRRFYFSNHPNQIFCWLLCLWGCGQRRAFPRFSSVLGKREKRSRSAEPIVPNHVSFLDAPLVAAFLPGWPVFAIDPAQMQRWWVRPFLAAIAVYSIDP